MKRHYFRLRVSPSVITAFCFFAGTIAGTVWVGLMTPEIQEQLGGLGQAQFRRAGIGVPEMGQFLHVLIQREMEAGFLWLIGMTAFSVIGIFLAALYGGISMSVIISLMTRQAGLMGLPLYLLSVVPQVFFYLPVIGVLLFWGLDPWKKTHVAGYLVLAVFVALGAFAETFLNPYCLAVLNLIK